MKCLITQLSRRFSNPLLGLSIENGKAIIQQQFFYCCQGKGITLDPRTDAMTYCSLSKRLAQVNKLLASYQQTWHHPFTTKDNDTHLELLRSNWIDEIGRVREVFTKGRTFSSKYGEKQASYIIWYLAIVAAWKYGIPVHVVTLDRQNKGGIIPLDQNPIPRIIFVDQKVSFHSPTYVAEMNALINWCEGSMVSLWLDLLSFASPSEAYLGQKSKGMTEDNPYDIHAMMKKKVNTYRQRPQLGWLGSDAVSRLKFVSQGYEQFLPQ